MRTAWKNCKTNYPETRNMPIKQHFKKSTQCNEKYDKTINERNKLEKIKQQLHKKYNIIYGGKKI